MEFAHTARVLLHGCGPKLLSLDEVVCKLLNIKDNEIRDVGFDIKY
jgi:hypothetical protein